MVRLLTGLAQDKRGNFTVIAALTVLPLLLAAGLALDFATLSRTRASLQQAMDSAALAIAREGKAVTDAEARDIAVRFLDENFNPDYTDFELGRDGTEVSVTAKMRVPLAFGALFGLDVWPVAADSSANIAYANYEIALVLDTTGSMKGGKLASMKEAVTGMVETMSAQVVDKDRLKFAVVPFANFVNVGPQFAPELDSKGRLIPGSGAPWLDARGMSPIPQRELVTGLSRFELFGHLGQSWSGCIETRVASGKGDHHFDDTAASAADPASLFVPAFGIDEPDGQGNSYIASGADPLDMTAAGKAKKLAKYGIVEIDAEWAPASADLSGGRGPNQACVTQPILPLTTNYSAVVAKVNSLAANGTTNIMEGVAWGQRVLSPAEPFTQGQSLSKAGTEKILIVLTDGANVFGNRNSVLGSSYSSYGFLVDGRIGTTTGNASDTNARMNARTLQACEVAKANGTEVYTIRLEEPDVATGTMLQECASGPANYFDAPSRAQLDEVFQIIRDRIVRIRIAS